MDRERLKQQISESADKLSRGELSYDEKLKLYQAVVEFTKVKKNLSSHIFFQNLLLCKEYLEESGYLPQKGDMFRGEDVGTWFRKQEKRFQNGAMPNEQIQMFEAVGLPLSEVLGKETVEGVALPFSENTAAGILKTLRRTGLSDANKRDPQNITLYQRLASMLGEKMGIQFITFIQKALYCKEYIEEHNTVPLQNENYKGFAIGHWYRVQKYAYLDNQLSEERRWVLDELKIPFVWVHKGEKMPQFDYQGLPPGKNSENWLKNLSTYIDFKAEFQREPFRRELYRGIAIGSWCQTQQRRYINRQLLKAEEEKLLVAGFPLQERKQVPLFSEMLVLYKSFKKATGREPSIKEQVCGVKLGEWLAMQDFMHSRKELPVAEHRKLVEAGFEFSIDAKPMLNWKQMFFLYEKFKKETGTEPRHAEIYCCTQLGKWVQEQRANASSLTEEQMKMLLSAGFVFDPKEEQWQRKFALLKEFLEEFDVFPHSRVRYHNVALGQWLWITQKNAFRSNSMPEHRKEMLLELGFSFDYAIDFSNLWKLRYEEFSAFVEKKNRLPQYRHELSEYREETAVGRWYQSQLRAREMGYLSEKQEALLQNVENTVSKKQEVQKHDESGER